jgi:hypothetical protein
VEFREILSRIPAGFESRQNQAIARNPGVGMSGQVLVHPSHICQIGESDQGRFGFVTRPESHCPQFTKDQPMEAQSNSNIGF